jgi:hypothetical protein
MSIPGTGLAVARYNAQDISPSPGDASWNFDADAEGALPEGAEVLSQPRFGGWAVRAEADAPSPPNALCQTGMAEFPSIALSSTVYTDLIISARFKPISGVVDQAAGLLYRIQDADNYYILRANALEGNVNFYKYASGRRSLMNEGRATVASGQWQELRVEAVGRQFRGFLNGDLVVEASDDDYTVAVRACGPKPTPLPASTMCRSPRRKLPMAAEVTAKRGWSLLSAGTGNEKPARRPDRGPGPAPDSPPRMTWPGGATSTESSPHHLAHATATGHIPLADTGTLCTTPGPRTRLTNAFGHEGSRIRAATCGLSTPTNLGDRSLAKLTRVRTVAGPLL